MPVSGLRVLIDPTQSTRIQNDIEATGYGEIAFIVEDYLVIVVEAETPYDIKRKVRAISQLPGIMDVSVAYYNLEDMVSEGSSTESR